jgi:hypothetical protein
MSNSDENGERSLLETFILPSKGLADWYVALGIWGLFLAIMNCLGIVHPQHRISWGGLLTFEMTNAAFDVADGFSIVLGDIIFIGICSAAIFLGMRTQIGDGTFEEHWKSSLEHEVGFVLSLFSFDKGLTTSIGGWLITIGLIFYIIRGILFTNWIDPGVYSVCVAMVASGLVMRMLANSETDE